MFPWAGPIVVVKKHTPEGAQQQFHLSTDYRKINSLLTAVKPAEGTKKGTLTYVSTQNLYTLYTI